MLSCFAIELFYSSVAQKSFGSTPTGVRVETSTLFLPTFFTNSQIGPCSEIELINTNDRNIISYTSYPQGYTRPICLSASEVIFMYPPNQCYSMVYFEHLNYLHTNHVQRPI